MKLDVYQKIVDLIQAGSHRTKTECLKKLQEIYPEWVFTVTTSISYPSSIAYSLCFAKRFNDIILELPGPKYSKMQYATSEVERKSKERLHGDDQQLC